LSSRSRPGRGGQPGRDGHQRAAGGEHPPPPHVVAERAGRHQRDREPDAHRADDPGRRGQAGPEVGGDRRQRRERRRVRHQRQERPRHRDAERPAGAPGGGRLHDTILAGAPAVPAAGAGRRRHSLRP
jgi:hypothetical protein